MKRALRLACGLCLWLGAALAQASPDALRLERLAEFGKLWAAVKYFHPFLAYKSIPWDEALLENLPKAAAARTDEEYAAAVASMLQVLQDPATRVLPPPPSTKPAAGPLLQWAPGNVLILALNPATAERGLPANLVAEASRARALVFDLRGHQAWAGPDSSRIGLLFVAAGLNNLLASGTLKAPAHRLRLHSGLAAPWEDGSAYYHSAFYVRDGAVIEPGNGAEARRNVVFLADRSSCFPPIAAALQAAGKALVVAEGGLADTSLVERNLVTLPGGIRVEFRTTELVYEDGTTGFAPDVVLASNGAEALRQAIKLAQNGASTSRASRPRLAAYGFARREEPHARPEYPGWELRMLAAFRIWAVFKYFFAYRELMERDWDRVLLEHLPRFERAGDALEYSLAIAGMLAATGDSHVAMSGSRAFDNFIGTAAPPLETRVIEGSPVVTYAAPETGLAPGDVVRRVNGEPAPERIARLSRFFAASTPQSLNHKIMQVWLNGPPGSELRLAVEDASGRVREVAVKRSAAGSGNRSRNLPAARILPGNIGYINLESLAPAAVDETFEKLKDTRAIIFDLRGYPQRTGWLVAARLAQKQAVAAALFRRPLAMPPGLAGDIATVKAEWEFLQFLPESQAGKYTGRTLALIDERTISQAEHAALFLRAAGGTVFVGSRSAGADGDVSRFTVPGGVTISFSGQQVLYPDGRQLQRVGLTPDFEAYPTIAGLRAGRDEVLEAALKIASGF